MYTAKSFNDLYVYCNFQMRLDNKHLKQWYDHSRSSLYVSNFIHYVCKFLKCIILFLVKIITMIVLHISKKLGRHHK